jgi:hypothetical protein
VRLLRGLWVTSSTDPGLKSDKDGNVVIAMGSARYCASSENWPTAQQAMIWEGLISGSLATLKDLMRLDARADDADRAEAK